MHYYLYIFLCALLTCCNFAPKYVRPPLTVAPLLSDHNEGLTEDAQNLLPSWKEFFISSSLQLAIQSSLDNNKDLKIALFNIEKSRAIYRIQKSALFPTIDFQGSMSQEKIPETTSQTGKAHISRQYNSNFSGTYIIDLFARAQNLNEAAIESYLASEKAYQAVKAALIAQTASLYFQWISDRQIMNFLQDILNIQQSNYNIAKASYQQGSSSMLDLMQAAASIEAAKVNLANYVHLVEQDKHALMILTGMQDLNIFPSNETLDQMQLNNNFTINLSSETLLTRPDIQQAEHLLKAQNANVEAARKAFFPIISLTGMLGFTSTALSNLFNGGVTSGTWNFTPQLTLPIFDGGKNVATLEEVKADHKISLANYEKAIENAFREVADELAARTKLNNQIKAQTEIVKAAYNTYNLVSISYNVGQSNYLTALNAQQALLTVQQNYIMLQLQHLTNSVNLYQGLGGGVQ
jgi:multidrug efflux system outer membrane protein